MDIASLTSKVIQAVKENHELIDLLNSDPVAAISRITSEEVSAEDALQIQEDVTLKISAEAIAEGLNTFQRLWDQ